MSRPPTFRLAFIRRCIITLCQSRALRAALLAALNGGPDAGLVVNMIEGVRPPSRLPTQVVAPMTVGEESSDSGEDTSGVSSDEEISVTSEDASTGSSGQSPPRQETPTQEERDTVIVIDSDSESDSDGEQN